MQIRSTLSGQSFHCAYMYVYAAISPRIWSSLGSPWSVAISTHHRTFLASLSDRRWNGLAREYPGWRMALLAPADGSTRGERRPASLARRCWRRPAWSSRRTGWTRPSPATRDRRSRRCRSAAPARRWRECRPATCSWRAGGSAGSWDVPGTGRPRWWRTEAACVRTWSVTSRRCCGGAVERRLCSPQSATLIGRCNRARR